MKGGPSIRVFSGDSPPDELQMQFEQWLDCMKLFIRYVKDAGWVTMSERFKAHMNVVMELRDDIGWMVALRYCRRVRQGLMRTNESVCDRRIEGPHRSRNRAQQIQLTDLKEIHVYTPRNKKGRGRSPERGPDRDHRKERNRSNDRNQDSRKY